MLSLITGVGARGQVGEAVAETLGRRGDTVLIVARTAADADARARELSAAGRVFGYACDLASEPMVAELAERIRREHGERLDALVNLAGGFAASGPVAASDVATVDRLMAINFRTAFLATRAFLPMVRAARGAIVYFASDTVIEGTYTRGVSAYVAAKSAVVALMRSVADEAVADGVRANALAPSAIRTATNEAGMAAGARFVEREDVAAAVAFLCSPDASAVTGQVVRLSPQTVVTK